MIRKVFSYLHSKCFEHLINVVINIFGGIFFPIHGFPDGLFGLLVGLVIDNVEQNALYLVVPRAVCACCIALQPLKQVGTQTERGGAANRCCFHILCCYL